jgi:hypothetical protein
MPEDIHVSLWTRVQDYILTGSVAVTAEIYEEMCHIPAAFGAFLQTNKRLLLLEVDDPSWNGLNYLGEFNRMRRAHHIFISEYSHLGSKRTICLNDLTTIALGKSLSLPVVSMEASVMSSPKFRRIPDICSLEGVPHLSFNDFLRREGISA